MNSWCGVDLFLGRGEGGGRKSAALFPKPLPYLKPRSAIFSTLVLTLPKFDILFKIFKSILCFQPCLIISYLVQADVRSIGKL